jgi:Holliday junction resolvase RusA-like endonuclease
MYAITVHRIPSVNHYVRHSNGRHYKSKDVIAFEKAVMAQLPPIKEAKPTQELRIFFILRKDLYRRDLDNMPKVFIDCLAKKYGFNDSRIEKITMEKTLNKTMVGMEKIIWKFV